jgi:quercetin dioxygenase-like cupin family protein
VTWFSGDEYTMKLTAANTAGAFSLVEASVPPGSGPVPHSHPDHDETFSLLSGRLEFLDGDRTFVAGPGDLVYVPRGSRHRFLNVGEQHATMLFMFTPGGPEGLFIEGGDEPVPGAQVQPWGPERITPHILDLAEKYGHVALPDPQ